MNIIDGRFVSNGEKNVYLKVLGLGDPAIVIEPGLGSLSCEWESLQQELSNHTTVITYDRPGYGESPKSGNPRTAKQIAAELFNILRNSGIPGPYILAGNSLGGLYHQYFANMFPREVAGIVFVDSITRFDGEFDKLDLPNFREKASMKSRMANIAKILELEGEEFDNYISSMLNSIYSGFPKELADKFILFQSDKKFYDTILDEYNGMLESLDIPDNLERLNIPVKVLNRDYEVMIEISKQIGIPEEEARAVEDLWMRNNRSLLDFGGQSEFAIVKGSNHAVHLSRPDLLLETLVNFVNEFRSV